MKTDGENENAGSIRPLTNKYALMNKYLQRGILGASLGVALCILGLFLMEREIAVYKWVLVSGVIVFGIGFLTLIYGLIRKIERRSILDERRERQQNNE